MVATLLLVLLGATLLGEAEPFACPPGCCPGLEQTAAGCETLSTIPCCHAARSPAAPTASATAPSSGAAPALSAFAIMAPKLHTASPALLPEPPGSSSSSLRLSVVLRI